MNGWLGIALGDVTGIGPEVTLKALASPDTAGPARFLLIGDSEHLRRLNARLGLSLDLRGFTTYDEPGRVFVLDALSAPLPSELSPGASIAANAALAWLEEGARRCLRGELDALITAPVNKEAILRAGHRFTGQTEFLSELAGAPRTAMMLLGEDDRGRWLRVALVTTHVPLRRVADEVTQARVELAIELAALACHDLGLARARVAVCGLNPHAGEGGQLGTEERATLIPAIEAVRRRGGDVVGPLAADTLFYQAYRGDFEAVVAMYHDQGLAPLKMIGFETGVNWTLGLPFIRTSPDHGTAYDLAGRGLANPSSMIAAIRLASQLARRRT
jgi:4-phospho-D-threonate 3-dehydrogenase / 4-phospho-D-erythronate 3-dehydrogenase